MKLLLTSAGFGGATQQSTVRGTISLNRTITNALQGLVGKDFSATKLVFIPTAANVEAGDKGWLIDDLKKCTELGFEEVDIVDAMANQECLLR
jgi:hypothetical protein